MRICFRRRGLRPSRGPDSAISGVLPNIRLPSTPLHHTAGARGDDSGDCAWLFRKRGWGWHRDEDEARGGVVRRWHGKQVISGQKNHAHHILTLRDFQKKPFHYSYDDDIDFPSPLLDFYRTKYGIRIWFVGDLKTNLNRIITAANNRVCQKLWLWLAQWFNKNWDSFIQNLLHALKPPPPPLLL